MPTKKELLRQEKKIGWKIRRWIKGVFQRQKNSPQNPPPKMQEIGMDIHEEVVEVIEETTEIKKTSDQRKGSRKQPETLETSAAPEETNETVSPSDSDGLKSVKLQSQQEKKSTASTENKHEDTSAVSPNLKKQSAQDSVEEEKTSIIEEHEITDTFTVHPICFFRSFFTILGISTLVILILLFLFANIFLESLFWMIVVAILGTLCALFQQYLDWKLNVAIIRNNQLVYVQRHGAFHYSVESVDLQNIKFVDSQQNGFWQTFFDYGDIKITSIVAEISDDITLRDIHGAKKVSSQIRNHAFLE